MKLKTLEKTAQARKDLERENLGLLESTKDRVRAYLDAWGVEGEPDWDAVLALHGEYMGAAKS